MNKLEPASAFHLYPCQTFPKNSTQLFHCFQFFHLECSTPGKTVLEPSRLSRNVSILRTFIIYGVSEAQSSDLTCQKKHTIIFQSFFCVSCLPKLHVKRSNFSRISRVSRDWKTDRFRAVDVMVMSRMATPSLHELRTSASMKAWDP